MEDLPSNILFLNKTFQNGTRMDDLYTDHNDHIMAAIGFITFGLILVCCPWIMAFCNNTWKDRKIELCACNSIGFLLLTFGVIELYQAYQTEQEINDNT